MSNIDIINQDQIGYFTRVSNTAIRDKGLSFKARGVLVGLLSLPPDWHFTVQGFIANFGGKKDGVQGALYELETAGYLKKERVQDNRGHFSFRYIVSATRTESFARGEHPETENPETENPETENPETENPETENPETENPETENPETENPETDNQQLQNTYSTNIDTTKMDKQDDDISREEALVLHWEELSRFRTGLIKETERIMDLMGPESATEISNEIEALIKESLLLLDSQTSIQLKHAKEEDISDLYRTIRRLVMPNGSKSEVENKPMYLATSITNHFRCKKNNKINRQPQMMA